MRTMRIMGVMASGLMVLCFCGCMALQVPKTTVSGTIGGQPFSLTSPKDSELTGLEVVAATNGVVSIKIQSLKATMNPAVITMTGDSEAKIIGAVANGVANAMGSAAGAAAAAAIGKP